MYGTAEREMNYMYAPPICRSIIPDKAAPLSAADAVRLSSAHVPWLHLKIAYCTYCAYLYSNGVAEWWYSICRKQQLPNKPYCSGGSLQKTQHRMRIILAPAALVSFLDDCHKLSILWHR